jgi:hypothetical protein
MDTSQSQTPTPAAIMDVVHTSSSLVVVPYLDPAFSSLRFIALAVEQAQVSRKQLDALEQSITQILQMLEGQYRSGRLQRDRTSMMQLTDLLKFV